MHLGQPNTLKPTSYVGKDTKERKDNTHLTLYYHNLLNLLELSILILLLDTLVILTSSTDVSTF